MGSIFSKSKASRPLENDDDESPRQAKRRKINHANGSNQSYQETPPGTSPLPTLSDPSSLPNALPQVPGRRPQDASSGLNHSSISRAAFTIDDILPKVPERALRIDLVGIKYDSDDDSAKRLAFKAGQHIFKSRCTIAIFLRKYENDDELYEVLRVQQDGQIRTYAKDEKYEIELQMREPFIIPAKSLCVTRKSGRQLPTRELRLHVWFESDCFQEHWPPLNTASLLESTELTHVLLEKRADLNDLWMSARDLDDRLLRPESHDMQLPLMLGYGRLKGKVKTPFNLQVEARWSLPGALQLRKSKHEAKPAGEDAISSQVVADKHNALFEAQESPQRAKRRREEIPNYNLKVLSDIARGDQPKSIVGRQPKRNALEDSIVDKVTYMLGRADAYDLRISRETTVSGLGCPFCLHQSDTLECLQWHLKNDHSSFEFSLRRSSPSKIQFFIESANKATRIEQQRSLQLGKPRTLLDVARLLDGDRSWEKARRGPDHNIRPSHMVDRFSSSSPSLGGSRYSSPNTSIDDCIDRAVRTNTNPRSYGGKNNHVLKSTISKNLSSAKRTVPIIDTWENEKWVVFQRPPQVCVPQTGSQLYHPVTRRRLKAGEIIDNSEDENDERWLNQKHRDIIMDYTNITDAEKDYVVRWNPFITMLKLTCDKYMPKVIVRFVSENKLWFLCREERIREFCKHAEALMLRGSMDGVTWTQCMQILKLASEETSQEELDRFKQTQPPIWDPTQRRGYRDCLCGQPVTPLDGEGVRCSGMRCRDPFFHAGCVKEVSKNKRGSIQNQEALKQWKCAVCITNGDGDGEATIRYAGSKFSGARHNNT
ncbi:hypothetical protein BP5796_01118 [Coleophoma crateriformis]|uniref:Polycomb protein VEFS-Box domain-containing protein n=1 Tax=Coleophoma crateriformis TaxID=565419 RepID=A0A3D8T9Z6_9HELO|nr:hypothetical protein BP5796_01118 [Coleophoma crateriformis]